MEASAPIPQPPTINHYMPKWLARLGGSVILLALIIILGGIAVAGYFGYRQEQREQKRDARLNMFLSYVQVINEQYAVRDYLETKIGDRQPPEVKSRMTVEIIDGCRRGNIPLHYALAIPNVEASWQANPTPTVAGAGVGYWQIMPSTAIRYFKARGWAFSIEALQDPIKNTAIAMDILQDYHEASVISGQSNDTDWVVALWNYNGKGEAYARKVITNSVEPRQFLDSYKPQAVQPQPEDTNKAVAPKVDSKKLAKKS